MPRSPASAGLALYRNGAEDRFCAVYMRAAAGEAQWAVFGRRQHNRPAAWADLRRARRQRIFRDCTGAACINTKWH